jgi:hypothetical protein
MTGWVVAGQYDCEVRLDTCFFQSRNSFSKLRFYLQTERLPIQSLGSH